MSEFEKKKGIALRKFPYPYKAALTLCSDIDGTSFDKFLEIHKFLNTDENCELGTGLDLEVGDSFWFYSDDNTHEHAFSYFQTQEHAYKVRKLIDAGYLDVLHSYGNFGENIGFDRGKAEKAVSELQNHDLKIHTWVNHGAEGSEQWIGANTSGKGDAPSDDNYYHADLLKNIGVKFFWENEGALTRIIGQDRPCSLKEGYLSNPFLRGNMQKLKNLARLPIHLLNEFSSLLFSKTILPIEAFTGDNKLLETCKLKDGQSLYRFKRFGHPRYDWSDDLDKLVNPENLDYLVNKGGFSIVYLHLGDLKNKQEQNILPDSTVKSLRLLSEYVDRGDIFTTTTTRLLFYNFFVNNLKWRVETRNSKKIIKIHGTNSSIIGDEFLKKEYLGGITFYVKSPQDTFIEVDGNRIEPVVNPPDSTGRESLSIPFKELEFPTSILH